jgi:hypothetical protein
MASGIYNIFKGGLLRGQFTLVTDTCKCCLLNTVHAFAAGNTIYGNISGNELAAANGYLAGGIILTSCAVVDTGVSTWDAADISWTSSTFLAAHAVIYDTTTGNSLVASIDFGGNKEVSSGTFTLQWNATGIVTLS